MDINNTPVGTKLRDYEKSIELLKEYDGLKEEGLWFYYEYYEPGERSVEICLNNKNFILFSTNNYLGLSRSRNVVNAAIGAVREFGVGSGASYAVTGGSVKHRELEKGLASFYGYAEGLLLSSGYMANSAVVSSLVDADAVFYCDAYLHASFRNSLKFHGINPVRYQHDNVGDLITKMKTSDRSAKNIIITESLFSQHGTIAKIDEIAKVAKTYGALLVVDDAHGLGTIGVNGGGVLSHYGMSAADVTVITGAMNKALGSMGGFILGSKNIIDQVKMKAHELIFTSSLPAVIVAAASASLEEIKSNHALHDKLKGNMHYFRESMKKKGFLVPKDITPIIPVVIGSMKKACLLSKRLRDNGIIAIPIIPPAVSADACLIRFQVSADHTTEDIDKLVGLM